MKLNLLRRTSQSESSLVPPLLRDERRRMRTSITRTGIGILDLVATAILIGCAGSSTSTGNVVPTGGGAATHTVDLSWVASTSTDVSGYNIYRADYSNSCGPFAKVNSLLITSTSYTDSQVRNGASYCYATTAVDSSNQESGYSNIVTDVQIPAS